MSKPVPRSRLTITYRTKIDGVVKKKRLPLRVLVLGNFTGAPESIPEPGQKRLTAPQTPYEKRKVYSIRPGTAVSSFMQELALSCPIDDESLRTVVPATMNAKLQGAVKWVAAADGPVVIRLSGEGNIEASERANGLCNLGGTVRLSGECQGQRAAGKITLTEAQITVEGAAEGDFTSLISYTYTHKFDAEPVDEDELKFKLSTSVPVQLTLALRNMAGFTPQHVASAVPEIHRLVVLRRLLGEIRNMIGARPDMRQGVKAVLSDAELAALQSWLKENYSQLALPADALARVQERTLALAAA